MKPSHSALIAAVLVLAAPALARAQAPAEGWTNDPPPLDQLVAFSQNESELRGAITHYLQDIASIERRYPVLYSPTRNARLRALHEGWRTRLGEIDFADIGRKAAWIM